MTGQEVSQHFLDSRQYTSPSILQYESVYGKDFVSPGGIDAARSLIAKLKLPRDSLLLDAGCGLGGSAFVMAKEFGYRVEGIDLSRNMLALAEQKLVKHGLSEKVRFLHGDCCELEPDGRYAGVYSRDVFLHIHDKEKLFRSLFAAMKNNGRLLFTDYCCDEKPWSAGFEQYVSSRNYRLHTLSEYQLLIEQAGFENVKAEDLTPQFIDILEQDMKTISHLNLEERDYLYASWKEKLARANSGHHRWGMFSASKP